jgi:hypothetical protein
MNQQPGISIHSLAELIANRITPRREGREPRSGDRTAIQFDVSPFDIAIRTIEHAGYGAAGHRLGA